MASDELDEIKKILQPFDYQYSAPDGRLSLLHNLLLGLVQEALVDNALDWGNIENTVAALTRWKDAQLVKCLPEEKDPKAKHLFETPNGTMIDTVNEPYINGFNACLEAIKSKVTREKK